jgi:hypothetical protein
MARPSHHGSESATRFIGENRKAGTVIAWTRWVAPHDGGTAYDTTTMQNGPADTASTVDSATHNARSKRNLATIARPATKLNNSLYQLGHQLPVPLVIDIPETRLGAVAHRGEMGVGRNRYDLRDCSKVPGQESVFDVANQVRPDKQYIERDQDDGRRIVSEKDEVGLEWRCHPDRVPR